MIGTKIRIFPTPTTIAANPRKLFVRVKYWQNPINPSYTDQTIFGVNNLANVPFGNLRYQRINSMGLQWIRQYTLALSMEQLGMIRTVTLNGGDLVGKGREDKKELVAKLKEMLETLTYDKLIENAATRSENLTKQLLKIPIPNGMAITTG